MRGSGPPVPLLRQFASRRDSTEGDPFESCPLVANANLARVSRGRKMGRPCWRASRRPRRRPGRLAAPHRRVIARAHGASWSDATTRAVHGRATRWWPMDAPRRAASHQAYRRCLGPTTARRVGRTRNWLKRQIGRSTQVGGVRTMDTACPWRAPRPTRIAGPICARHEGRRSACMERGPSGAGRRRRDGPWL